MNNQLTVHFKKMQKGVVGYIVDLPSLQNGELISVFAGPPLVTQKQECVVRRYKVVKKSNGDMILDYVYPNDCKNIAQTIRLDGDANVLCWASKVEFISTKQGLMISKVEGKRHKILPKIIPAEVTYRLGLLNRIKLLFQ
jgi:hypothetical protein